MRIQRYAEPKPIRLPDQTIVFQTCYAANVTLHLGSMTTTFAHIPLLDSFSDAFEVILGNSWLSRHRAVLDYGEHTITIYSRGRRATLPFSALPTAAPKRVGRKALRKILTAKNHQRSRSSIHQRVLEGPDGTPRLSLRYDIGLPSATRCSRVRQPPRA